MAENIFILGAGTSFEAHAPLMNDFLDSAEDVRRKNLREAWSQSFASIFELLSDLDSIYAKFSLNLNNIEVLFGVIEMAKVIRRLGSIEDIDQIEKLRNDLITLIVRTLENTLQYPVVDNKMLPPVNFSKLISIIDNLKASNSSSAIITFNYDLGIDYAVHFNNKSVDYGLYNGNQKNITLLKLHGSTNWMERNNNIEVVDFSGFSSPFDDELRYVNLSMSHKIEKLGHKGNPLLVPPTWNKTQYHGAITNVWNRAAKELAEARNIFVFGYSLPETDSFFKYLLALGTQGPSRLRRFYVYDPDNKSVEARYRSLIGNGLEGRFDYKEMGFGLALNLFQREVLPKIINEVKGR